MIPAMDSWWSKAVERQGLGTFSNVDGNGYADGKEQ